VEKIYLAERPLRPYSEPFELPERWKEQYRALRAETQAFFSECSADFHSFCLSAAREITPDFFFIANGGPLAHNHGIIWRVKAGLDITRWSMEGYCTLIEDMQHPGMIGDLIVDNIFTYKLCRASGQRAALLLATAQNPDSIALSMAEASAGDGCLIQGGYGCPEVRRQFDRFWESNRELFEGKSSFSDVLLIYHPDELFHDNTPHLRQIRQLIEHLSDHHITFDLMLLKNIGKERLSDYRVVILPCISDISPEQVQILWDYAASEGQLVIFDSLPPGSKMPEESPWSELFPNHDGAKSPIFSKDIKAIWSAAIGELMPEKGLYFFDLTERECGNFEELIARFKKAKEQGLSMGLQPPGRLVELINRACGRTASLAPDAPHYVRIRAFVDDPGDIGQIIVHVLNYNLQRDKAGKTLPIVPVRDVRLTVPLPDDREVKSVRMFVPGGEIEELPWREEEGLVIADIQQLKIYAVVELRF